MKKYSILLAALLMTLTGCKDARTSLSDASDVLVDLGNTKVTKGDVYESIVRQGLADTVIIEAKTLINKDIEITDAMKQEAQGKLNAAITSAGSEEAFLEKIKSYGYDDTQSYVDAEIMPDLQEHAALVAYSKDNLYPYADTYVLRKIKILQATDSDSATKAIDALKAGTSFDDVFATYNINDGFTKDAMVVSSESDINSSVLDYLADVTTPTLSSEPITDADSTSSSPSYFVVSVIATSADLFADEAAEVLADIDDVKTAYYKEKFKELNFRVYDKDVYDELLDSDEYSNYLNQ